MLDPDLGGKRNVDPCGTGFRSETLITTRWYCTVGTVLGTRSHTQPTTKVQFKTLGVHINLVPSNLVISAVFLRKYFFS